MFPKDEQILYRDNIEGWLDQLENQQLPIEESLNKAYEKVYSMNLKPGIWNKKVNEAMYKWLLACQTSLPIKEILDFIMVALQHDPDIRKPLRPLTEEAVLDVWLPFIRSVL